MTIKTFIVYAKSTLVLVRKGQCGFFLVMGFALEEEKFYMEQKVLQVF